MGMVSDGITQLDALERHATVDVNEHVVVLDSVGVRLEEVGLVFDALDDCEERLELAAVVGP